MRATKGWGRKRKRAGENAGKESSHLRGRKAE